jgi:asparaginyl-tRNA synthetase
MFQLEFFNQRSYLIQTGQLYLEAWIPRLKRVWCIGPSFRAEPYVDERHLCEFPLVEMELECDFQQLLSHVEGLICSMVNQAGNDAREALENLNIDTAPLRNLKPPFKKIAYTQAIEDLRTHYRLEWGADLKAEHEKCLAELYGMVPLFITHYPEPIKFFNMKNNDEDPRVVNSADLILPHSGEAVGSAEREHRPDRLLEKLRKSTMLRMLEARGGSIRDFDWYIQQLQRESVPHAGCGVGLNRVTQFVLRETDIRRTTPFPLNMATLL